MTPSARVQAAIDILDAVIAAARGQGASADRIAAEWFRARRFVGSKDRRAIRDMAWNAIRACGDIPENGRAAMLRLAQGDAALAALFDGSRYGPAPIGAGEGAASGGAAPQWLLDRLEASGLGPDEQGALLARAPLDLRANGLKITREELADRLPVTAEPTAARQGLRLAAGTAAESWPEYAQGLFEVQDTGSQLSCEALDVRPGETVVDLCAGAGGKTLALAAAMGNTGRLIACDIDRARLSRLPERAARAGALAETRLLDPGREMQALADLAGGVDAALVDAPCSGTGTWRRNPEARWRLTPAGITRYAGMQANVLRIAADLVAPGGRLVYIVCSLLDQEGADVVRAFLAERSDWVAETVTCPLGRARGDGWRLTPFHDGTDGFFFARLRHL
ncbi:RsmB/NOP family class I SAM-dependent RNA methyltransferase [Novosphingobium sp. KCTC 2891]|uniref:RsmB/NOP family class I SAM-dependent RNA methyltransferase n=1 Tax=Novosphingobium sp. KCTC 2891 TaxID=2989730 RepID=UPI002223025E|nr:RsmB/NOP family class I SAM-dependent RNA methyltransferase [Novosphingobium sp. KCTC 2891]MCW1384171.1 RsmB/NOP family class I SAM-dependent RNA methyltransferase [Novosphingobium sp. KCTC 2891]